MKGPQLMIDYENRRVFCNVCGRWVGAYEVNIDGTHDYEGGRSTHTVWERP